MKKKVLSIIGIVISILLIYGSTITIQNTIINAQDRLVDLKYNKNQLEEELEPQNLEEGAEEGTEEVENEEVTNSYTKKELATIIISSVLLTSSAVLIIYIILILFGAIKNINSFKVTFTYALLVITLSEILILTTINHSDKNYLNGKSFEIKALKKEQAYHVINKRVEEINKVYESTKQNESVLKITDKATYIGENLEITKTSGNQTEKKDEINNCVVATNSSKVTINNSNITSNNESSSAIYATKINTVVELNEVNITTTKNNSIGIITKEDSELTISDSDIQTLGINSEIFNSSSNIIAKNIKATTNSNIASIYQANKLTISNSTIETQLNESKKGIFIINSEEEEYSDYTNAQLSLERNTIKINSSSEYYNDTPLFYVRNTNSKINLTKNTITYGKNTLLKIETSAKFSSKLTTLTMTDTIIKGNILADSNSEVKINLNNVTYTGSINNKNESQSVDIVLDSTSRWNVNGHSYINKIQVQRNTNVSNYIYSNGYNIYYNASNNEELKGRTIKLPGGGKLIPVYQAS